MLLLGILALTEYNVYSENTRLSFILVISKHSPHNLLKEALSVVIIILISQLLQCPDIYKYRTLSRRFGLVADNHLQTSTFVVAFSYSRQKLFTLKMVLRNETETLTSSSAHRVLIQTRWDYDSMHNMHVIISIDAS